MKLAEIAVQMMTFARATPYPGGDITAYRHELTRGLALVYTESGGEARLGLTRPDVPPSSFEEQICRQAFSVPPRARREALVKGDYHHVVLAWSTQPPYLTVEYPAAPWLAVPAGGWQRSGDKIVVEYQDYEEMFWSVTLSVIAKEVETDRAKSPEQITMFENKSKIYYGG